LCGQSQLRGTARKRMRHAVPRIGAPAEWIAVLLESIGKQAAGQRGGGLVPGAAAAQYKRAADGKGTL